jgi:hypothetical protein
MGQSVQAAQTRLDTNVSLKCWTLRDYSRNDDAQVLVAHIPE